MSTHRIGVRARLPASSWRWIGPALVGVLIVTFAALPAGSGAARPPSNTWPLRMAAASRALTWLHTQQAADGTIGARTADAVYVIARAGENPDGPAWRPAGVSAVDALRTQAPTYLTDAGRTGKFLRAAASSGQDVRNFGGVDLVARANAFYNPATGWYHPGHLYFNALAIQGLAMAGQAISPVTIAAIRSQQHTSGGWEWAAHQRWLGVAHRRTARRSRHHRYSAASPGGQRGSRHRQHVHARHGLPGQRATQRRRLEPGARRHDQQQLHRPGARRPPGGTPRIRWPIRSYAVAARRSTRC